MTGKRRSWLQLHLSTLISCFLLIGALIGENLRVKDNGLSGISMTMQTTYSRWFVVGWPIPWYYRFKFVAVRKETVLLDKSGKYLNAKEEDGPPIPEFDPHPPNVASLISDVYEFSGTIDYRGVLIDLVCSVFLCLIFGYSLEYVLRRREAHRP